MKQDILKIKRKIDIKRWLENNVKMVPLTDKYYRTVLTDDLEIIYEGHIRVFGLVYELPDFIKFKKCQRFTIHSATSNKGFPLDCRHIEIHNNKVFRPGGFKGTFINTKHNREMHPDGQTTTGRYDDYLSKYNNG